MMKKQLHKIITAAENFSSSRASSSTKQDKNSEELLAADKQVERYKDVLEKISKKFTPSQGSLVGIGNASTIGGTTDQEVAAREKRCKKVHEFRLAQAMEESLKDLPDGQLRDILDYCAKLERNIANEIINNEINVETDVTKKLTNILENHLTTIQKQKRLVNKLMQDNESAKNKYQAALRVNDNTTKIQQLREEQEECEMKLDKERDIWASELFELIADEDEIINCVANYVRYKQLFYKSALSEIEDSMERMNTVIKGSNRKLFKVPLDEHLTLTNRNISYVIEVCVCSLLEKGLYEEGLLRVGCAGTKLRRMKSAFDAHLIVPPIPTEYQDPHVIACVLKSYLRDLPDPLLTFKLYDEFIDAAQRPTEEQRKQAIRNVIHQLPEMQHTNLRYLTKFLSYLSQKQQYNKMSTQNIAIVMSPNLLWSPYSIDKDLIQKVNSTAAVNTIVELLVSEWNFFFDGEVNFYDRLTRDELFPENGGFSYDRDPPDMTKSLHIASDTGAVSYQTHSRSSSHDTSLILMDQMKRSQSNSSLSDNNSSPPQSSPKLPVRRRHNKQAAPTPPDSRFKKNGDSFNTKLNKIANCDVSAIGHINTDDNINHGGPLSLPSQQYAGKVENSSQTVMITTNLRPPMAKKRLNGSNENLTSAAKPDKPPRPVMMSSECQTLNRSTFKSKAYDRTGKPVAMPRSTVLTMTQSNENLVEADKTEDDSVFLRDKNGDLNEKPDKPAIPERPSSLMRPPSLRAIHLPDLIQQPINNTDVPLQKMGSFRSSNLNNGNSNQITEKISDSRNELKAPIAVEEDTTTDELPNDVDGAIVTPTAQTNPVLGTTETTGNIAAQSSQTIPPSPRGFDPMKIKRPQVPAPPPPVARPKSDDSTNL